jgi:hypothetical protein
MQERGQDKQYPQYNPKRRRQHIFFLSCHNKMEQLTTIMS